MNKKQTLEEFINSQPYYGSCTTEYLEGIEEGAKWQEQRMYSEEDVINALHSVELKDNKDYTKIYNGMKEWFDKNTYENNSKA